MSSLKITFRKTKQAIDLVLNDAFYRIVTYLLFLISRLLFRVRIYGREKPLNWRKQHHLPFVVVARHKSYWDIPFLPVAFGPSLKNRLKYVAKNELKVFFQLIPLSNNFIIYIDRDNPKKSTIEEIIKTLKDGNNVAIFPEGTTVPENKKFFGGIILVVKKVEQMTGQEIPIFALNVKTKGPYGKPKGKWYYYLSRMVEADLRIGGPIFYRDLEKVVKNKELTKAQKRAVMVEELLRKVDQI
ncbi:MAG: lysophospholipid acyltransferase family protein [Candidatus Nealsonbacteria bacterium]|nr:lysophospholipid acyltransferase family protein [Candidatus Nealsonbacteria bacterium]